MVYIDVNNLSQIEKKKIAAIIDDPVKWAQVFVKVYSKELKKYVPWVARWYQVSMLRDESVKKVARCGRRTGEIVLPVYRELLEIS